MTAQEDLGDIKINNDVVAKIASLAAIEVEGIISLAGKYSLAEMWGRKDIDKGIAVEITEGAAEIDIEVNVEYGIDIYKAAHLLQKTVSDSVERMTGLRVDKVNVSVRGIVMGEPPRELGSPDVREVKAG